MRTMAIDIEVDVSPEGWFPRAERNAIICIGVRVDGDDLILMADTHDDDSDILERFINYVEEVDPDVITGFNIRDFDLPYIVDRCRANNIDPARLGRDGFGEEYSSRDKSGKLKVYRDISLGRRTVFDTYTHWAAQDDQLFGLPDRRLKTLAKHFEPDYDWVMGDPLYPKMRELVGTPTLRDYMESDLRATQLMFDIYFPVFDAVAALLGNVTVKEITENTKGFLGMHVCRTCCDLAGITYEGTNYDRWGDMALKKQAAITNTFIPNKVFENPTHLDFSSMYPSIVMTFNISPETTRIRELEKLGRFHCGFDMYTRRMIYSIPDEKLDHNVVIEIDEKPGQLPMLFKTLYDERVEIKKKLPRHKKGSAAYKRLRTKESAVKMIMNSTTGYMGESHAKYADMSQYIAIVGLGRELFKRLVSFIEHKPYDKLIGRYERINKRDGSYFDPKRSPFRYVIEGDTDGIYLAKDIDLEVVNRFLDDLVKTEFKTPKSYMKLGKTPYKAIYCPNYKGKAYILVDDDKVTFKGVAFKSSRWPPLFNELKELLARAKFLDEGEPREIYLEARRLIMEKKLPVTSFAMHMEVRDPESYAGNCLPKTIATQARERFKMDNVAGTSFSYVKMKSGYWIVRATDDVDSLPAPLDTDYYLKIVDDVVERLGMSDDVSTGRQVKLSELTGVSF